MLNIGAIVDNRYKIIKLIGQGGTSSVYLAENMRLGNKWAIKEVYKFGKIPMHSQPGELIAEASVLPKLVHKYLPKIVDVIETNESYLIIMEYIEGNSLDRILKNRVRIPEIDVINWSLMLCDVVQYLHSQNPPIIYRDLKPANIMLRPDNSIALIDFGMARPVISNSATTVSTYGTHGFAAPEQYDSTKKCDCRTDIYAFGMTIYNLVTGLDPCVSQNYTQNGGMKMNMNVSPQLAAVIQKCTAMSPENRYRNVGELKDAITAVKVQLYRNTDNVNTVENYNGYGQNQRYYTSSGNVNNIHDYRNQPVYPQKKKNSYAWVFALIPVLLIAVIAPVVISLGSNSQTSDYINNLADEYEEIINENQQYEDLYYEQDVFIENEGDYEYYTFVPEISGKYHIYSRSDDVVPIIWIYDESDTEITSDNARGEYSDFDVTVYLEAGETYYITTALYDLEDDYIPVGYYTIYIESDN